MRSFLSFDDHDTWNDRLTYDNRSVFEDWVTSGSDMRLITTNCMYALYLNESLATWRCFRNHRLTQVVAPRLYLGLSFTLASFLKMFLFVCKTQKNESSRDGNQTDRQKTEHLCLWSMNNNCMHITS